MTEHTWNHRVIRITHIDKTTDEISYYYQIHEVHYEDGTPTMVTQEPVTIGGEDIASIKWTLDKMSQALQQDSIPMEYFDMIEDLKLEDPEFEEEDEEDSDIDTDHDLGGC